MVVVFSTHCKGQVNPNDIDLNEVQESTVQEFFNHMIGNMYPEKVAKRNYYIFGITNGYLLYGKTKPKLFSFEISEIYKIDSTILVNKFPNYDNLSGVNLMKILKEDIKRVENLGNINEITIDNYLFSLNTDIGAEITYYTTKNDKKKTVAYKLRCSDFSIIK